jgi:hypothetical protein
LPWHFAIAFAFAFALALPLPLPLPLAFTIASSYRHPERSEGPRRNHLAETPSDLSTTHLPATTLARCPTVSQPATILPIADQSRPPWPLCLSGLSVGLQPHEKAAPKRGFSPEPSRPTLDTAATIESGRNPSPAQAGLSTLVP